MRRLPEAVTPRAWLVLPGHRDAAARVRVIAYPFWSRFLRSCALAAGWAVTSAAVFFVTMFDPFLTSIPAIMGVASVWRSWRGHFRVEHFEGDCPRCSQPIPLKVGSRIGSPHRLVCYHCHHEPHLALAG